MIRNQIIQITYNLFAQKGIAAVSMEQIAMEAGISEKIASKRRKPVWRF